MRAHPASIRQALALAGGAFLMALALVLVSCSSNKGTRVNNIPPNVRLSGGPVAGDSVSYTTEFFWTGWDDDGIIDHYQFTIDIPDSLLDFMNDPTDRRIAWTDTTAFRARFLFTTPYQDTIIQPDGSPFLPQQYRGNHCFYVRAFDNEGAVSRVDYLCFTARTVTPRTKFTLPTNVADRTVFEVGKQMNVAWEGVDPDNPDPRKRPKYYDYKLFPLPPGTFPPGVNVQYMIAVTPGPNYPWTRVGSDTTTLRLNLNPPEDYIFALRAIDEAGGTESNFVKGQNAIVISSSNRNPGTPVLTVKEKTLGQHVFPDDGPLAELEVPVGRKMRFEWQASADAYGGVVQGYNYGVDVPDVEQEGPNSGFRGWSLIPYTFDEIFFLQPGVHTLTIKCRDTGGGVTIATVLIRAIAFPLDREVLYVDDYRLFKDGTVGDHQMDQQVHDIFTDLGLSDTPGAGQQLFQLDAWNDLDVLAVPNTIKLSDLARYRLLFWSVLGSGYGGHTALVYANACSQGRVLEAYCAAGGGVWIYGKQVFSNLKAFPPGNDCIATLSYSEDTGLNFAANDFAYDFLHISGGDVRSVVKATKDHGLVRAKPTAKARAELFPQVEVDSTLFNYQGLGGIPFIDATFQPVFDQTGGLDTLYLAGTVKNGSRFANMPIAFRYHDPNPLPQQGPVAVFAFPYHFLKAGSAKSDPRTGVHGLARSMYDWFEAHRVGGHGL